MNKLNNEVIEAKRRKAIGMFLDVELLAKVNAAAKEKGVSRAAFIRNLLIESV